MLNQTHATATGQRRLLWLLPSVLLLLLAIGNSCCHALSGAGGFSMAQLRRGGSQKLCGPVLNEAMQSVCVQGYNTLPKKRSEPSPPPPQQQPTPSELEVAESQGFALSPMLSSLYGTEVLVKTRRLRRQGGGIHEECCKKPCSYYELLNYCRQ